MSERADERQDVWEAAGAVLDLYLPFLGDTHDPRDRQARIDERMRLAQPTYDVIAAALASEPAASSDEPGAVDE